MKYLSPFYILPEGFELSSLNDKKSLKKARKLILAEFELLGKTTIIVNNQELDKNDVLNYFEALERDSNLGFHLEIFQHKALLSFLEDGNIDDYKSAANYIKNKQFEKVQKTDFIDFVSPYFANHYNELFQKAVRKNDYKILNVLLENNFPLPQKYEVNAYQSVYRWCHGKLKNIESIQYKLQRKQFVSSKEINYLIDKKFIKTFNLLPIYFHNIRDRYTFCLYEIVVILNNDLKRVKLARSVVDAGLLIKADHETNTYFQEANRVIDRKQSYKSKYSWIWLFVIFQGILIISRIATCNTSSSLNTNKFDYPDVNYIINHQLNDSIFRIESNNVLEEQMKKNRDKLDSLVKLLEEQDYEGIIFRDSLSE